MKTNKFLLEVEEMKCSSCNEVTGHAFIKDSWTCIICGSKNPDPIITKRKLNRKQRQQLRFMILAIIVALPPYILPDYILWNPFFLLSVIAILFGIIFWEVYD